MDTSEKRFELLKLVHRHGLDHNQVIGVVKDYEAFLNETVAEKPAAPKKAAGSTKSGEPSK